MSFRKSFLYCDVHSNALRQWKRIKIDDMEEKLRKPSKNYRCFASIQRYEKARHEKGETMWMPVFFDLDAKDPNVAREDVVHLAKYLTKQLDIPKEYIRIYFSGKKGFHVVVTPEVFDITPHPALHLKVKKACLYISELLSLRSFDASVYSTRRVLRVHNSIHESTKLFKIELSHHDLHKEMDEILELAKHPQKEPIWPDDIEDDVGIVEDAKNFWDQQTAHVEEAKELSHLRPDRLIKDYGEFPVCVDHILSLKELPKANTGNRTLLALASYLKDAGRSEEDTSTLLVEWAKRQKNIGDAGNKAKIEANTKSTVQYMYRGEKNQEQYHFACKFILGLGTAEHKIPCQGLKCPAIRGKMQETKEVIDLQLADFSKSIYLSEKVRLPCLVSGKAGTPYVVPKRVRFTCVPDPDRGFCEGCPISAFNGEASFEFSVNDTEILEIINVSNSEQWSAIKRKWGFPKNCRRAVPRVEEFMNVEEVRMAPAAVNVNSFEKSEFVARKGFFLGYPLTSNKRYTMEGFPVKDPKSQSSAFLFEECNKLETEIENFKMSKAIRDELQIFKVAKGSTPEEKFREIHQDLATNVYRIKNRMETAWVLDLTAHSIRGFKFRQEPFVKGWMEVCILGDSGQGKTSIARRLLQEHYKIGEYISGGSAKRTGLLYSYQENGRTWMLVWGAIPLNDLGLCIIDEFGDLPEDQFALLTDVRSSGIVKAVGVVTAETFGRVRLIALSNPKKGKHLAEFEYPCHALKELVPAAEDIRRFDMACAVASGEVSVEVINSEVEDNEPHIYTKHLCSQLIRWAWSRTEHQVRFKDDASKLILSEATRMAKDFYSGEIPLVEPADHRFKIARISAAVAARLFSTEDGENLIVTTDHVHFAVSLMYLVYCNPNFRYREWSKGQMKSESAGTEELELAFAEIRKFTSYRQIIAVLRLPGQIEARDLEGPLGGRAPATAVFSILRHLGILERKWGKYFRTAKGNAFLKWIAKNNKVTKEEMNSAISNGSIPASDPDADVEAELKRRREENAWTPE